MEGASEYMVVEGVGVSFNVLRDVVGERHLTVVEEDPRHHRLAFRLEKPDEGGQVKALCAILDVGHGLSKLVVVCVDEADGSVVAPDASLTGLFMQVDHMLHEARAKQRMVTLPPLTAGT